MEEKPGDRLKKIRAERYRSAAEAARAMNISPGTYSGHENGNRPMSRDFAIRYALFFNINLHWLLTGKGKARSTAPVQRAFDELPAPGQEEMLSYIEYLRNKYVDGSAS